MIERKQYTKEFKLVAISLVLDQGHTPTEVSRERMGSGPESNDSEVINGSGFIDC